MLSNHKQKIKVLPNGDLWFKGSVDQIIVFLKQNDAFEKIKTVESVTPRYFLFGEYIITITISKQ